MDTYNMPLKFNMKQGDRISNDKESTNSGNFINPRRSNNGNTISMKITKIKGKVPMNK